MTGLRALENINETIMMDEYYGNNNLRDIVIDIKQTNGSYRTYIDIQKVEGTKVTCWEQHKNDSKLVTIDLSRYEGDRVQLM